VLVVWSKALLAMLDGVAPACLVPLLCMGNVVVCELLCTLFGHLYSMKVYIGIFVGAETVPAPVFLLLHAFL
jgi:hypothetical protein